MKFKKKIFVLFLFTVLAFCIPVIDASASTADLYGFSIENEESYNQLGWQTYLRQRVYHDTKEIGCITSFVGYYQVDRSFYELNSSFFTVLVMIKMTPENSSGIYGFSDDAYISSNLRNYYPSLCSHYELVSYSPLTQTTDSSYLTTIGGSLGSNTSISASTTIDAPHDQYIYNHSNSNNQYYSTEYDYYIKTNAWFNKSYVREETVQRSMYMIEDLGNSDSLHNSISVYARFAYASDSTFFTKVQNDVYYETVSTLYYYG